jgi:hypothetical protein
VTNALETDKQTNPLLRRLVAYLRVPVGIIALSGLALSAWVHISSMRGIDVETTWPSVRLLHYALLPIVLVVVLAASAMAGQKRLSLRGFLALVPGWALALLAAALVYAVATFLIFTPSSGAGDPLIHDGRFFFNDHGTIREVTEDQFHLQRSVALRLYSSVWMYLYLVAVVYLLGARRPREAQKLGHISRDAR